MNLCENESVQKRLLLFFVFTTSAFGGTQECFRVDQLADWVVTLDETAGQGDFFDSDHHTPLLLTDTTMLNTYSGIDGEIPIKVVHNQALNNAVLYDWAGTLNEVAFELHCNELNSKN